MTVKTFEAVSEIKATREEGKKIVFNAAAALAALKATPMHAGHTGGGAKNGALKDTILQCIATAKESGATQISMNQIKEMLGTAGYDTQDKKQMKEVSDKVWGISDKNKNCKAPVLKGVKDMSGVYEIC